MKRGRSGVCWRQKPIQCGIDFRAALFDVLIDFHGEQGKEERKTGDKFRLEQFRNLDSIQRSALEQLIAYNPES